MTADRWRSLTSGSPDETTKIQLAELLADVTANMSLGFNTVITKDMLVMETQVQSGLCDLLPQMFPDVLGVEDRGWSDSMEPLMDLMVKEVKETEL